MADAEKVLGKLLQRVAREQDRQHVEIKPITSGGANYTSALFLATLSSPQQNDINVFAKVANIGSKLRAAMNADTLFRKERFFYSKLMKIYTELQEAHNVPDEHRLKFPKFYGLNENYCEETVVLENLVAAGYSSYSRFQSLDWLHAAKSVETLASFHALSFAFQKENPEEFEDAVEVCKFFLPSDGHKEENGGVMERMTQGALQVLDEEDQGRLMKYLADGDMSEKYMKYNCPIGRPVLIHGDYRPSNLLFKKKGDSLELIPVDYQTLTAGSPVSDLVYLISMGTDSEFRRLHYQDLIDHYYLKLGEALKRLSVDIQEVYDRKTFDDDLKEMLPYSLLLGVIILPIVTVEAESAPCLEGDTEVQDFVLKPNELYAARFRGLVADCIKWGII